MFANKLMRFMGILCTLMLGAALQAQAPALKTVVGEVTEVDASAKQIKLKADKTDTRYTVLLNEKTSLVRLPAGETDLKKALPVELSGVTAGDRMLARGPIPDDASPFAATRLVLMSKSDIAKKQERDRTEWQQRGIVGTVSSIDPGTKEITVATRGRDAKTVVVDATPAQSIKRYAEDSTKFLDAKPSAAAQIQTGDTIRVLGDKNEDGTRIKAEEIVFGSFQTIAATISSIDTEKGLVRVQDLNTKKPVDVAVTKDTLVRRLPPMVAQGMAARLRGGATPGGATAGTPTPAPSGTTPPPARSGGGDLGQMLERLPAVPLSELKNGDALIVSSSRGADPSKITAFTLVAGVEPFLQAAPRSAGQINLGSWSMDGGIPEQ
jgi:hypothetical protein